MVTSSLAAAGGRWRSEGLGCTDFSMPLQRFVSVTFHDRMEDTHCCVMLSLGAPKQSAAQRNHVLLISDAQALLPNGGDLRITHTTEVFPDGAAISKHSQAPFVRGVAHVVAAGDNIPLLLHNETGKRSHHVEHGILMQNARGGSAPFTNMLANRGTLRQIMARRILAVCVRTQKGSSMHDKESTRSLKVRNDRRSTEGNHVVAGYARTKFNLVRFAGKLLAQGFLPVETRSILEENHCHRDVLNCVQNFSKLMVLTPVPPLG